MVPSPRDEPPIQPDLEEPAYLVLARDAAGTGEALQELAPAHWDYMDRFADRLIARGPMLSSDGEEHAGSVHILTAASALDAQRFADEEPFHRAGLYTTVTVTRFENLLGQTMWERAPMDSPAFSTFLLATWPPQPSSPQQIEHLRAAAASDKHWVFLGVLLSSEGQSIGLAAAADRRLEAAERAMRNLLQSTDFHLATIELTRWQRGGRQAAHASD